MRVMPVLVSYKTHQWIKVSTRSFFEHFPEREILVIDNNPQEHESTWEACVEEERQWLQQQSWLIVIDNPLIGSVPEGPPFSHGSALDHARSWCMTNNIETMLIFEPDCVVRGRAWFEDLVNAVAGGAWMAGILKTPFGPLKPCPSAWRVDRIHGTFCPALRKEVSRHPRYAELVDDRQMRESVGEEMWNGFWREYWDTGFNNWFYAAIESKAVHVKGSDENECGAGVRVSRFAAKVDREDFQHIGSGSTDNRGYLETTNDPEIIRLLSDDWRALRSLRTAEEIACE